MRDLYPKNRIARTACAVAELNASTMDMMAHLMQSSGQTDASLPLAKRQDNILWFLEDAAKQLNQLTLLVKDWGDDSPGRLVEAAARITTISEALFARVSIDEEGHYVDAGLNPVCADCGSSTLAPKKGGVRSCGACGWQGQSLQTVTLGMPDEGGGITP